MKKVTLAILVLVLAVVSYYIFRSTKPKETDIPLNTSNVPIVNNNLEANEPSQSIDTQNIPQTAVVATGLDTPWAIAFLPQGGMLVTERKGTVRLVNPNGELQSNPIADIESVLELSEGGLHGIALHPDFSSNNFVYLYYTYSGSGGNTLNRVVRMTYANNQLSNEEIIVEAIPGNQNHDGGRIKFGPDGYLYVTTGDAQNPSNAQNKDSLAGKVLRLTGDGGPAPGNPFGNRVYSFGHRNPQGITWDQNGQLWSTEHGPSGSWPNCCQDEFNRIGIGKNYGWPDSVGDTVLSGTVGPVLHSSRDIWAPAGLAFVNGKFYFGGLRGQALYRVTVSGNTANLEIFFKGQFGRIREVIAGPDGMLYITTSNRDGRGNPASDDDKVIRVNPEKL